ncbi:MAG: YbfB/YjiJ family MFS transporter [Clostridiales bacterium]|nr:YbfB/YjiJ family MFS transporter [Clostridiales bacterium]
MENINNKKQNLEFWVFSLTGLLLVLTTSGFARMAYGAVLPYMQASMELSNYQTGLIGTVMFLGYLLTVGLSGVLALRWGAKAVLLSGGFLVLAAMAGISASSQFWVICLFMFLSGAGSSLVFTPLMSIVIGRFPQKRGMALGILLSGAGIGMLLSGFLIPVIIKQFPSMGWRAVWIFFAVISLIVLVIAFFILKNPDAVKKSQGDEKPQWLKNQELMKVAGLYFFLGVAYLIPNLYQTSFMLSTGYSNEAAGSIYAIAGIFSIVGGPIWGSISDKAGPQKTLLIAWCFAVLGDLLPILMTNTAGFVISSVIWGSSIGGLVTLIQVKGSEQVPAHYVSAAIGFISIFYAIGQALGPVIAGWIIDHMGGFMGAYGFGASIYFLGLLLTLGLKNKSQYADVEKIK